MARKEISPKEKIKAILEARIAEGDSLRAIAERAGVSYPRVHNFYSGRRDVLDVDFAQQLLRGLDIELVLK